MAIQAQMADGRVLEFPDGTDTAVIQSTVQRLISAAGPDKQPSLGSPMGEDFGSSIMASAQPKRESVLQGIEMPAPAAAPFVKPQFIDALQANLNALPEAERTAKLEQFKQRPDVYGKAANVIAQRYAEQNLGVSPTLQKLTDLRLEPQVQRFMEQGMEPEAAKNLAAQQAMMGRARPDLQQMNVDVAGEQAKAEAERVAQEMKDAGFITRVGAEAKGQATQTGLGLMSMYADLTGDKDMQGKVSGAARIQEEAGKAIPKGEGIAEKAAQQALASAAVQAPIMLLGTLTGTSAPILLQAGIQSLGSSYSEGRQAGLSPEMAMGRAAPMAAAEVLFERFGMTKALGGLKKYMNQAAKDGVEITGNDIARYFGKAIASEIPSEMETTLAQYGIDVLPGIGLNKNPSVEDLYKQLEETLRQTVIQSGAMAGAGAGVVKGAQAISSRLPERRQSYEQDTSIAGTAEQMARERGFFAPEQRAKPPVVPATSAAPTTKRIEPTFEPDNLGAAPTTNEPTMEPATNVPFEPTNLAKQRAEEQKSVLNLEQELEAPKEAAPVFPKETAPVAEAILAAEAVPTVTEEVGSPLKQRFDKLAKRQAGMQAAKRDGALTNEEYTKFTNQLNQARSAYEAEKFSSVDLTPQQKEGLVIADQLEQAGHTGFAGGMRLNIERNPNVNLDFYRQKLHEVNQVKERAQNEGVAETRSLNGYYDQPSSRTNSPAFLADYRAQAPQKIRMITDEAESLMQELTTRINAAGFKVDDVSPTVGATLLPYKKMLSELSGSTVGVVSREAGVRKKYKNSNPVAFKTAQESLRREIDAARRLLNEEVIPLDRDALTKVPAPQRPEVEELMQKQELASKDVDILSKRTAGGSLMKVLEGSLKDGEMSELAGRARQVGKNPFISLVAKKGTPGASMEDMVNSGKLDKFLPEKLRPGHEDYVNSESAEYIRDKLRQNQYYTYETQMEIDRVTNGIWDIEKLINEELSIDDINKEIQLAADEQRESDLAAAEYAAEGAPETAEEGVGAKTEEDLIDTPAEEAAPIEDKKVRDKLMQIAKNLGVHIFETTEGYRSSSEGFVSIPPEDKEVEGAVTPEHVFAHELGHAIMQKRGMAFNRMPREQVEKWIPGFASLKEISQKFRPDMWKHKLPKIRRHVNKTDEIIADALGSYLLGESTLADIQPLIKAINLTEYDLGEKKFDQIAYEDRLLADLKEKEKQREADELLKSQTEEELRAKQDEIDRLNKESDRLTKEIERKAQADEQVDNFVLTGSNREADEAAARGQQSFLDVSPTKALSTDSAAFKRWSYSLPIYDSLDDNPSDRGVYRVYHATRADFEEFLPGGLNPKDSGPATWLSPYADYQAAIFRTGNAETGFYEGTNVMPLYARVASPLVIDDKEMLKWSREVYGDSEFPQLLSQDTVDSLKADGYDAIIFKGEKLGWGKHSDEIIVFDSTQLKSVIGNNGEFDPNNPSITQDISTGPVVSEEKKRNPSLKRKLDKLNRDREGGKLTDEAFIEGVDAALEDADKARMYAQRPPRTRGADFIRQRLLEAKRRGDLSDEAVDFAEWFIQRNPQLVEDLGISIRASKQDGVSGQYFDVGRLMVLMKKSGKDTTTVHEILHHLERMMPPDMQNAIRKAWSQEFGKATQRTTNKAQKDFFKLLGKYHWHGEGREVDFDKAVQMVKDGQVPSDFYQYVNPSEFWAVNGTDIMQNRFNAVRGGVLVRLKNWLKELSQKIKSMAGMGSQGELIKALDSLSKGDGKFQSKEMLGESSTYASVGKTIFNQKPLVNWTTPDQTGMDQFIKLMQNKHIDTKRVIDSIESTAGQIEDRWNPYLMEENFHGRTAKQTKDFLNHELKPLFNDMREFGVSMDELEEYLHNRHAQERNEQIAQVNVNMPDKGSGIETAGAQKYLTSIPADKLAKYKKLAKMVDSITSNTRQLLIDSGLESEETIQKWEDTYKHYIPLNRDDVDYSSNHGMSVGQGYSVKGTASRRATGSERAVVDILANIAMQRERNIVRAEKNRVATALYGLALKNSNPKFWLAVNPDAKKDIGATVNELVDMGFMPSDVRKLMEEPRKKEIDPRTGLVTEVIHQIGRGADNVMALRVNGENRFVFFNQNNDRANSMVRALKNLDADQLGTIMSGMALATRYIASINTQYNPVFGALNFARDVQGAVLQLSTTPIAGEQKAVMLNVMPAMMGIYKDLRLERDGKIGRGQWSRLWEEFQQHGGQTGFRDQFSRAEERGIALQRIIDPTSWTQSKMGKVFSANGTLTVPIEVARKTAAPIFNWLSDYNETMENSVRLAAYKVALDKGFSKDRAASIAKNLTVNFNRKGDIATQAGAMYAFFNASVQGTTRLAQTLAGPAGAAIVGGGLLLGTIEAVLMHMAGFGDDDPPDFVKEKNLIIPTFNGGKYIAIPLALGYNVIPNFSRLLTEATMRYLDGKPVKAADTTFKVLESLMGAFNPIGNAGWSFQTFAPTVADPFVALGENKDWTGKKIAREDFNSLHPTPGYLRAKESASTFGRVTSKWINSMSGGTEDTKGKFSPTPDQIDYLVGQATGGVGREGMKIERFIKSKMTGEELPSHSVPVFGRFYGDTKESSSVANQFYQNLIKMNEYEDTVKGMAQRKENVGQFLKENPEAVLYKMADQVERNVQKLRKLRHNQVEKEASKEVVKGTEKLITNQMMILNDQIEKLEKQRANK